MNNIDCNICGETVAYTNRSVSKPKKDFLQSDKLTNNQKWSLTQREKLIYCVKCYNKGVKEAKKEMLNA